MTSGSTFAVTQEAPRNAGWDTPLVRYRLQPVTSDEVAHWDELIADYESAELFHRKAWLDYLAASRGVEIRRWTIRADGDAVGYFCGGFLKIGPFRILGSPLKGWGTNFMGPVVNRGIDQRALVNAIDDLACEDSLAMIELEHSWLSEPVLEAASFIAVPDWTYLVDLTPQDVGAMWRRLESTCRNRIRKAESAGLTVEDADDPSIADEYYDQYRVMLRTKGLVPSFPQEHPALLVSHLKKADCLFALRVKDRAGSVIATALFPHDDRTMYFWSGASWAHAHQVCPNDYVHWRAMQLAADRGLTVYNMCGYGRFKRKFGGRLTVTTRWHKCYQPTARVARQIYEHTSRARASIMGHWQRFVRPRLNLSTTASVDSGSSRTTATRKSTKYQSFRLADIWNSPLHDFPIRDELLHQYFVFPPDTKMLEIGPGAGFTSFWMARNIRHLSLVDVAPANVRKLKTALSGVPNVRVMCADVCEPGLERRIGDGFDAAYAIEVLEFLSDPAECMRNLATVLRPGASLLIQFPNYPPPHNQGITYFCTRKDLDDIMRSAGFASWDVYALHLRPVADALYRTFHERPVTLYRRLRQGRGPVRPLNYDDVWAFQQGHRLEPYKYVFHGAWALLLAAMHLGGPCFTRESLGDAIVNRNLLVLARR